MRTNAIVRIILFSIAIIVLAAILCVGIAVHSFSFDRAVLPEGTVSSTGTADADTIRRLNIEWAAGTITIRPADVTAITLTETAPDGAAPMIWQSSGDTLKVSYTQQNEFIHFGSLPSKDLLIEVPLDWACTTLKVDTASSDLVAERLTISRVDFDGASGTFHFQDCTVNDLEIDTASGNIHFTGALDSLDCDAASADCVLVLTNCPDSIELDMASGDLDLTIPEDCGFTASLEALSGDLDTDFEITRSGEKMICGDGSCRIDISAMSGDVMIRKGSEATNCDH